MSKLTHQQLRFLFWLSLPGSFLEVSRKVGFMDDEYNGLQGYAKKQGGFYKFDILTLYALEGEGLVKGEIVYYIGIPWEKYTLTEKGDVTASLLSIAKEFHE
ncbi:hypothetical protein [Colwellia hornerae]|uniref:Uncharacterized protein n=1 Tax=Colwellia hornerae TaxID=89402 RepID=A0A5C6Q8E1_9GAMM|nr:hypothetical protein [Colwellia hornerae]TWX57787.1 hypothetical protein ESZ28_03510 [Colwellia hornerae]TWX62482.1 hypothetical protein ESZ26_01175 [Colwellia hornerae]TWX65041.1 hypothetical protein ESZ27_13040 [Colwellia hornerae]